MDIMVWYMYESVVWIWYFLLKVYLASCWEIFFWPVDDRLPFIHVHVHVVSPYRLWVSFFSCTTFGSSLDFCKSCHTHEDYTGGHVHVHVWSLSRYYARQTFPYKDFVLWKQARKNSSVEMSLNHNNWLFSVCFMLPSLCFGNEGEKKGGGVHDINDNL